MSLEFDYFVGRLGMVDSFGNVFYLSGEVEFKNGKRINLNEVSICLYNNSVSDDSEKRNNKNTKTLYTIF